jgi:hypothetical protein
MITRFHTNIDCAKRFMRSISGLVILPMVGDIVRVYNDSESEINMAVVERQWTFTNGANPILICELGIPPWFEDIPHFVETIGLMGFNQ